MREGYGYATTVAVVIISMVSSGLLVLLTPSPTAGATSTQLYNSGPISHRIPGFGFLEEITPHFTTPGTVTKVRVRIRLNHTFDSDLIISLIGPDGTSVMLSDSNGEDGQNYGGGSTDCSGTFTEFDDAAGSSILNASPPFAGVFRPESPLSALNGRRADGPWTLRIEDDAPDDEGTLFCWQLEVTREEAVQPPPTPTRTPTPTPLPPVSCAPRPRVEVMTATAGPGRVSVALRATGVNNSLQSVRFDSVANGRVDIPGGPTDSPGGFTHALPSGTQAFSFFLRRSGPGAATAPFVVLDRCGDWRTFAGFGAAVP